MSFSPQSESDQNCDPQNLSREAGRLELRASASENGNSQEAEMDRIHLGRVQHRAGQILVYLKIKRILPRKKNNKGMRESISFPPVCTVRNLTISRTHGRN